MLCHSKVMDVFIKAAEYMEMPVRRSDDEPLQKLFVAVRSMRRAGITPAPINRFSPALKNLFRSSETIARGAPLIVAV